MSVEPPARLHDTGGVGVAGAGGVRVGLCGWTISMAAYVRTFPLVEVQHTFYEPPADALLARWRSDAPGFEFTIKAWKLVTHESSSPTYRRLKRPLPEEHRGQVSRAATGRRRCSSSSVTTSTSSTWSTRSRPRP